MNLKYIILDLTDEHFPTIKLNCPQIHNAFNEEVINELILILNALKSNTTIRGVFLTGVGRSFSAGANLAWMQKMVHYSLEENIEDAKQLATLMQLLHQFPLPTIALVNGAAYGGGVGLVAACDMAFASDNASFCCKILNMIYSFFVFNRGIKILIFAYCLSFVRIVIRKSSDLNMRTKTNNFIGNVLFETFNHPNGNEHHCYRKCNS